MRRLTPTQEVDVIRDAIEAANVADWPVLPLEVFYQRLENEVFTKSYELSEKVLGALDPLSHQKHMGLSTLDDYAAVSLPLMEFMLLLGIEYGRRLPRELAAAR